MNKKVIKKIVAVMLVLSASMTLYAQEAINPKDESIYVVGHDHMDMNWLWTYEETIKMSNDNLRQMVSFFREFPDFKMVQSQPAVYEFVRRNDPLLFKEIKKYIKEGRLEPVGGTWTESDNILTSGEALARSFLLGQKYFEDNFGKTARVGWFPDDFGHNSQLPQLLNQAGIKYYFFTRCAPYRGSFTWEGSDGSEVIAFSPIFYNSQVGIDSRNHLKHLPAGNNTTLIPVGVGDHGGGPTRADIDSLHILQQDPDFPEIKFSTASEFFDNLEGKMGGRPHHKGEMQFIFEGCYTSVAEIKEYNRKCENTLFENEYLNSMAWLEGAEYPSEQLERIWRSVAFNQFHDILPGSAIFESNRENVARYEEAYREAKESRDIAFWNLCDKIDFQKGLGQPVVVFNMQPCTRKALVEAEVFSYDAPASASLTDWLWGMYGKKTGVKGKDDGSNLSVYVRDGEGHTYTAQVIEGKMNPPGWRSTVQFVVDSLPAGYKTFYIDVAKPSDKRDLIDFEDNRFTTDYYVVGIDPETGAVDYLEDIESGRQYVAEGKEFNTLRMYTETKDGQMKSWTINHATSVEDIPTIPGSVRITNGPGRACIECDKKWGNSTFHVRTYIYKSYPRIDYDIDMEWLEWGSDEKDAPLLRAVFPLNMDHDAALFCETPFDVCERPSNGKWHGGEIPISLDNNETRANMSTAETRFGHEVPAQKWSDVYDGENGLALINNSKYGYCYDNGELRLSLIRTGGWPDHFPNLGRFNVRYSIMPHKGDWKVSRVLLEGEAFNCPAKGMEPLSTSLEHDRKNAPEEASLISLDAPNVLLSAVKKAEHGNMLIIRLCEMAGEETAATLSLPGKVRKVQYLTILEKKDKSGRKASRNGNDITVCLKPHEIVTLGIKL